MPFKIDMKNVHMTDVGVGVSLPKGTDADLRMDQVTMVRGRGLVEERDDVSLVEQLGLPPETPPELLAEVIRSLQAIPNAAPEEKLEVLKKSKLWTFIERSTNVATAIQGLFALGAYVLGIPSAL